METQIRFLHEELLDSDDMPFYDEVHRLAAMAAMVRAPGHQELVPDFLDATFGVLRFHVPASDITTRCEQKRFSWEGTRLRREPEPWGASS